MFLKRLAVIVITLIMLIQLTACKQKLNDSPVNKPVESTTSQTTSGEEIHNESNSQTSNVSNDKKDETSSENNQKVENLNQDDNDNSSTENSKPNSDKNTDVEVPKQDDNKSEPEISCVHGEGDPYQSVSKAEFYANYETACCNLDASYRSKHGLLSGSFQVPGQYVEESKNRPMSSGKYVRNTATYYLDNGNTYIVIDAKGKEVLRIHKAGGYITLEEVAAYMYAFGGKGQIPANYTSKKSGKPSNSIWGEYLRVNHSYFSGDTDKYPYEPVLPDISGCGGKLQYYEMDIGTTGTVTPGYVAKPYIQGNTINRGAARIVYARQDLNGNGSYEKNEVYLFYTHNHYNDFREYLNYFGGWGEMFGNVTGGGVYSSKADYNPTPYVKTAYKDFSLQ